MEQRLLDDLNEGGDRDRGTLKDLLAVIAANGYGSYRLIAIAQNGGIVTIRAIEHKGNPKLPGEKVTSDISFFVLPASSPEFKAAWEKLNQPVSKK